MQSTQMQPLSGKELEYIADSISNEDLLIKQLAATAGSTQNSTVNQICSQQIQSHTHHLGVLVQLLQQHQQYAPTQPQQ
ncbi:hypothetical protein AMQ84_00940 [Paenibacillus riograndensis]|uniref:Spore coat protein n=1 Tax=Paenibacillus riograndensis TaxID=483937 RepID=A0A132UC59_9BACL|nr:hypothetical protein [Paenibacillus riograndensis]KWX81122.1 hypothetical protein AMQ84_00940 [Paenibacillus riograndensis]KWX83848.1 hypothetical protein AMQ83_30335 [Paenibacillus riograndensis]